MPYPVDQFPVMGQGIAKLATDEDLQRDEIGFTNQNLHQRVDIHQLPEEVKPKEYTLMVQSTDYFRAVESYLYSEDDDYDEIP